MEQERNILLNLPWNIVEEVFQYLDVSDVLRLECCCRKLQCLTVYYWRQIKKLELVPFLQKHGKVDVSNVYRFGYAASGLLARVGPYLQNLELSKFGPLEYGLRAGLEEAVVVHCRRLVHLELNNRLLERDWLIRLAAASCDTVREVAMSRVYIRDTADGLTDNILGEILNFWTELHWLRVRDNKRLRMSCFARLPSGLRYLDVQGCSQLCNGYLMNILTQCPRLESIALTYSPSFLLLPTQLMVNIQELNIDSSSAVTFEDQFTLAVGSLRNLKILNIPSHLVNDWLVRLVAENMTNLEELVVEGSRVAPLDGSLLEIFMEFAKKLKKLRKISLRANVVWARAFLMVLDRFGMVREADLSFTVKEQEMGEFWGVVRSNSLEKLVLRGLMRPNRGPKNLLAFGVWKKLKENCPKLKYVIL